MEVNRRVTYPIKSILIDMQEQQKFNLDDQMHKYCVSWFAIQVAKVGMDLLVMSWNEHPIPG